MMIDTHITTVLLLEYVDGTLNPNDRKRIEEHLRACTQCRILEHDFRQLDGSLRALPTSQARAAVTTTVMARILSSGSETFSYRLLKGLAYIVAMSIVLAVMGVIFSLTGVISMDQGHGAGVSSLQAVYDTMMSAGETAAGNAGRLLAEYAPFMAAGESAGITIAILVVVIMFGLFDRMVGERLAGRLK